VAPNRMMPIPWRETGKVEIGTRSEAKAILSFKFLIVHGSEYIHRLNRAQDMSLEFMCVGSGCRQASLFSQDGLKRRVSMVSKLNLWFPTGQHEKQSSLPGTLSTKDWFNPTTWPPRHGSSLFCACGWNAGWNKTDVNISSCFSVMACIVTYFVTIYGVWIDLLDSYKS
jgi:hypothetical protein